MTPRASLTPFAPASRAGNGAVLTDIESSDGSVHYAYDPTGQLTAATYSGGVLPDESYTWDANGNPTGSGYVVGADNRLLVRWHVHLCV